LQDIHVEFFKNDFLKTGSISCDIAVGIQSSWCYTC